MEVAIIGLPQCGKTTVFDALTQGRVDATAASEMHVGVVKVADSRLDVLAKMYRPKKVVHAEIKYWDLPSLESLGKSRGIGGKYLNVLQTADAFLLVIRTFTDLAVPHPMEAVDASRDLANMLDEIALADLVIVERAVERLEDGLKKSKVSERSGMVSQLDAVAKAKQGLEAGTPLRRQQLSSQELAFLANYQLLTTKPVIVVFNTDEAGPEVTPDRLVLKQEEIADMGHVSLCGKLEADLAHMPEQEADEFRSALGLGESAVDKVINTSYDILALVSFLTVGDDEVRAWSVPSGMPAPLAAGTIHTDFKRGFIRAEVIPFHDLVRCGGLAQGRREGVLRTEGKAYGVQDGDVINFLVNV